MNPTDDAPFDPTPVPRPDIRRIHLVTATCIRRRRIFASDHVARVAAASIVDPDKWLGAQLLCWVLMPDHWLGLIQLGEGIRLESVVASMKGRAARAVNRALHRKGYVWMPGFHDEALREPDDPLEAARRLVAQPRRAGLVRRTGDYPYWDAVWARRQARELEPLPYTLALPRPPAAEPSPPVRTTDDFDESAAAARIDASTVPPDSPASDSAPDTPQTPRRSVTPRRKARTRRATATPATDGTGTANRRGSRRSRS